VIKQKNTRVKKGGKQGASIGRGMKRKKVANRHLNGIENGRKVEKKNPQSTFRRLPEKKKKKTTSRQPAPEMTTVKVSPNNFIEAQKNRQTMGKPRRQCKKKMGG